MYYSTSVITILLSSHLYLTYQHRTINLIDFSGGNVKTDVFRFINFCFRFSTASRDVFYFAHYTVPGRRTKPKIKVDNTKKVRLDPRARESWLGWWFGLSRWGTDATSVSAEDLALTARDDILRWILLSLKRQPNQLSRAFPSRRTFFVLSTFIFGLVRRPGTYFFLPIIRPWTPY